MKNYTVIIAIVALLACGHPGTTFATIVTDNNLSVTGLGALTNTTTTQVS